MRTADQDQREKDTSAVIVLSDHMRMKIDHSLTSPALVRGFLMPAGAQLGNIIT